MTFYLIFIVCLIIVNLIRNMNDLSCIYKIIKGVFIIKGNNFSWVQI